MYAKKNKLIKHREVHARVDSTWKDSNILQPRRSSIITKSLQANAGFLSCSSSIRYVYILFLSIVYTSVRSLITCIRAHDFNHNCCIVEFRHRPKLPLLTDLSTNGSPSIRISRLFYCYHVNLHAWNFPQKHERSFSVESFIYATKTNGLDGKGGKRK